MKKCFFSSRLFSRNDYRQMLNLLSIKSRFQARSGLNATFFKSLVLSLAPIRLCCTAWWARAVHSNSYKRTAHNNKLSHSLSLYFYFLSLSLKLVAKILNSWMADIAHVKALNIVHRRIIRWHKRNDTLSILSSKFCYRQFEANLVFFCCARTAFSHSFCV